MAGFRNLLYFSQVTKPAVPFMSSAEILTQEYILLPLCFEVLFERESTTGENENRTQLNLGLG